MILKDLPIGAIVTDKKTKFNDKPIEWIVTDHEKYQDGTVLLSKDILCCKSFNDLKGLNYIGHSVCWENSSIRNWLKTDFFYKSFSLQFRCMSIPVKILECNKNGLTRKIKDNVFLLSSSEIGYTDNIDDYKVLQLFKNIENEYIMSEACHGLKWSWWLRSTIENTEYVYSVDTDGSLSNHNAHCGRIGIRPACVISDYAPIKKKKNGDYKFDWLSLLKFD